MKIYIILLIILFSCSKKNDYDLPFQFWSPEMIKEFEPDHSKKTYNFNNSVRHDHSVVECLDICVVTLKNDKLILSGVTNFFDVHSNACADDDYTEASEYSLIKKENWLELEDEKIRKLTKKEYKLFLEKQKFINERLKLDFLVNIGVIKNEKKDFFRKILGKNYLINQYEVKDFNQDGVDDYLVFFSYPEIGVSSNNDYIIDTGFAIILGNDKELKIIYIYYDYISSILSNYFEYQIHKIQGTNLIMLSRYSGHRCNVLQSIDLISFK